jgi:hypothetical protein
MSPEMKALRDKLAEKTENPTVYKEAFLVGYELGRETVIPVLLKLGEVINDVTDLDEMLSVYYRNGHESAPEGTIKLDD